MLRINIILLETQFLLKSFRTLLAENKGKILELESVISEISVSMNYLNYEDPYIGSRKFRFFAVLNDIF